MAKLSAFVKSTKGKLVLAALASALTAGAAFASPDVADALRYLASLLVG